VIDPDGNLRGGVSGEGNVDALDRFVAKLVKEYKAKGTLSEKPIRFDLARFREKGDTPLFFPGKVLADEKSNRLFIADSTHHRLVVTDLAGEKVAVVGTGEPGKADGAFEKAQFDDPQGMALDGETLYVADRKNHLIRAVDFKARTVKTIAGTGTQNRDNREFGGPALETGLNSPWDLLLAGKTLYIAMAGHHQIWTLDLDRQDLQPYAGNGRENIRNGDLEHAEFAQPSGLTTDGKRLYVADSEVSAIRSVSLDKAGDVDTLVGKGLFVFGDEDGEGDAVRLQHALGVVYQDGKLYVADTYNSKLKVLDPATKKCSTFLGGGAGADRMFNEPAGLSVANGKLYVADTNAHRIRVVELATKQVTTLTLQGVDPVAKN
jgi:DNA-binding beta-propeller fold protein YncE